MHVSPTAKIYPQFQARDCVCVCVWGGLCVCERERKRERERFVLVVDVTVVGRRQSGCCFTGLAELEVVLTEVGENKSVHSGLVS